MNPRWHFHSHQVLSTMTSTSLEQIKTTCLSCEVWHDPSCAALGMMNSEAVMIHVLSFFEDTLDARFSSKISGMWIALQVVPLLNMFLQKSNKLEWLLLYELRSVNVYKIVINIDLPPCVGLWYGHSCSWQTYFWTNILAWLHGARFTNISQLEQNGFIEEISFNYRRKKKTTPTNLVKSLRNFIFFPVFLLILMLIFL